MTSSAERYLTENLAELWMQVPGFDDLLMTGENIEAETGARYTISAKAASGVAGEAMSWGAAEPVDVAVARWMIDGAVAYTESNDNRTSTFAVRVSATDSAQLGAGEEALQLRAEQTCLLRWVAPEGAPDAPASVFEVWTWHLAPVFDLDGEMRLSRLYTLTLTAKPWVRAADLSVVPAVPSLLAPSTTEVDTCSSTTGWSSPGNTVTTSGGAVKVTVPKPAGSSGYFGNHTQLILERSGVTSMTTTPYVRLDMGVTGGTATDITVTADGVALAKAAQIGPVSWWTMPAGVTSFTLLRITALTRVTAASATLAINDVSKSNAAGAIGTAKQTIRHIDVGGSVETDGSIQIAATDGTTPLGWVLAATWPDNLSGYNPCLRQYRNGGTSGATSDGTCVSGYRDQLLAAGVVQPAVGFQIAPQNLAEASYVIVARMKSSVANNDVDLALTVGVAGGIGLTQIPNAGAFLGVANTWLPCILGETTLPAFRLPQESTLPVSFSVSALDGAGNVYLDEIYLIDVTHGDFSLFDAYLSPRAWLDAPDVDPTRNRKAIYIGASADRSDAYAAPSTVILNPGDHRLHPLGSNLLVVTDNTNSPNVTASFYRRGNTHLRA